MLPAWTGCDVDQLCHTPLGFDRVPAWCRGNPLSFDLGRCLARLWLASP
jgi:hypothetical protein